MNEVEGEENITVYLAPIQNPEDEKPRISLGERRFCRQCGSFLWVYDPEYPEHHFQEKPQLLEDCISARCNKAVSAYC